MIPMGLDLATAYYADLVASYVRGQLGDLAGRSADEAIAAGIEAGLHLHQFKRTAMLPRVQKVLGILRGMAPESLLDVGSGRGVSLWPLLDAFPALSVTAIDLDPRRVADLDPVRRGGVDRLRALRMDVNDLQFPDDHFDGVAVLEVFEHLPRPEIAMAEVIRVARRFVVASVPSHPDNNPQHLHLFEPEQLEEMLRRAGARRVRVEHVLNHRIALAQV